MSEKERDMDVKKVVHTPQMQSPQDRKCAYFERMISLLVAKGKPAHDYQLGLGILGSITNAYENEKLDENRVFALVEKIQPWMDAANLDGKCQEPRDTQMIKKGYYLGFVQFVEKTLRREGDLGKADGLSEKIIDSGMAGELAPAQTFELAERVQKWLDEKETYFASDKYRNDEANREFMRQKRKPILHVTDKKVLTEINAMVGIPEREEAAPAVQADAVPGETEPPAKQNGGGFGKPPDGSYIVRWLNNAEADARTAREAKPPSALLETKPLEKLDISKAEELTEWLKGLGIGTDQPEKSQGK